MAKASEARVNMDEAANDEWTPDNVTDADLTKLLGFQLRMANVAIYRDFAAEMGDLDLTQKQTAILFLVGSNPGIPQVAIGQRLGADRATIMAMVDRLESRGFLRRERSKIDRRRQDLFLTTQGKKTLAEAHARIATHEEHFTKLFTRAELRVLMDALRRIQSVTPSDADDLD
jgi:DNA-binding MarR family transcriptional regulator